MVSCSLKFLLESYVLLKDASLKSLNINIVSKNNMVIEKTRFVEVRFRGKPKKVTSTLAATTGRTRPRRIVLCGA